MLSERQIDTARRRGHNDAAFACLESGDRTTPSGGWGAWLINGCGVAYVENISGTVADSSDWRDWLTAYGEAAKSAAKSAIVTEDAP